MRKLDRRSFLAREAGDALPAAAAIRIAAVLLLASGLVACGGPGATPPDRNATAAAPGPSPSTGAIGAPDPSLETGSAHGPLNSFIVCPGNPRCPPEGSQPKGVQRR